MSSKHCSHDDTESSQEREEDNPTVQVDLTEFSEVRKVVLNRDRHRCTNCKKPESQAETLDVDHKVPRGSGGSDLVSNLHTLCRKCHDAKENDTAATSVEWMSTGRMDSYEFSWFRQVMNELLPALARQLGARLSPKFKLEQSEVWEISVGDLSMLDQMLAKEDDRYEPFY
jgi:5-methylcytosine-specific restriction protein A